MFRYAKVFTRTMRNFSWQKTSVTTRIPNRPDRWDVLWYTSVIIGGSFWLIVSHDNSVENPHNAWTSWAINEYKYTCPIVHTVYDDETDSAVVVSSNSYTHMYKNLPPKCMTQEGLEILAKYCTRFDDIPESRLTEKLMKIHIEHNGLSKMTPDQITPVIISIVLAYYLQYIGELVPEITTVFQID